MSAFADLESLIALTASMDSGKLEEVYASVATHISAQGAAKIAEAVTELTSIGVDPSMYIAPSRAWTRRQRELDRLAPEKLAQLQQRQLHDLEIGRQTDALARSQAATALAQLAVEDAKLHSLQKAQS